MSVVEAKMIEQLEDMVEFLETLEGKEILIAESLTRSRSVGRHDRHFATLSQFKMRLESVGVAFSGLQLMLLGQDVFSYGIAVERIVKAEKENQNKVVIVEWFESEMERRTTIHVLS